MIQQCVTRAPTMENLQAHSVDGTDRQVSSSQPLDTNVVTKISDVSIVSYVPAKLKLCNR